VAAIYSKLLAAGQGVIAGTLLVYTAPPGVVVVVRDIVLVQSGPANQRLGLFALSGGQAGYITTIAAIVPLEQLHWDGRQVLRPGEQLYVTTTATLLCFWRVSGYEFSG